MSTAARPEHRLSLSFSGLICSALGFGMLFSMPLLKERFSSDWNEAWSAAWIVTAALFLVWGITHAIQRTGSGGHGGFVLTRHRVALPRQGIVFIVIMVVTFTGAMIGRTNMLMLVFSLMAAPFVLNGWVTYSMLTRLRVSRQAPSAVMAGELATIDVTVENRKLLLSSWALTVEDRVSNARENLKPQILYWRVPPRKERRASYQLRLMQRGRYTFGPLQVTTRFPLGLVERGLYATRGDVILVYPRIGRLSGRWRQDQQFSAELAQERTVRRGAFDDEFFSIREFRSGDNARNIHWRTSARQNQLMVREYRQNRDSNLLILVDLWRPAGATEEDEERVELAVSFAATACVEQLRGSRDARLEVGLAGLETQRWEGRSGPAGIESLLEMFALAMAGNAPSLEGLLEIAERRPAAAQRTVLVTTRRGEETMRAIAEAASRRPERSGDALRDVRIVEAREESLAGLFELT